MAESPSKKPPFYQQIEEEELRLKLGKLTASVHEIASALALELERKEFEVAINARIKMVADSLPVRIKADEAEKNRLQRILDGSTDSDSNS